MKRSFFIFFRPGWEYKKKYRRISDLFRMEKTLLAFRNLIPSLGFLISNLETVISSFEISISRFGIIFACGFIRFPVWS